MHAEDDDEIVRNFLCRFKINDSGINQVLKSLDAENRCAICQSACLTISKSKTLFCGHEFHVGCIETWVGSKHTAEHVSEGNMIFHQENVEHEFCPICRKPAYHPAVPTIKELALKILDFAMNDDDIDDDTKTFVKKISRDLSFSPNSVYILFCDDGSISFSDCPMGRAVKSLVKHMQSNYFDVAMTAWLASHRPTHANAAANQVFSFCFSYVLLMLL